MMCSYHLKKIIYSSEKKILLIPEISGKLISNVTYTGRCLTSDLVAEGAGLVLVQHHVLRQQIRLRPLLGLGLRRRNSSEGEGEGYCAGNPSRHHPRGWKRRTGHRHRRGAPPCARGGGGRGGGGCAV